MVERLPSLYQDDDLARRFTAGLDEVLAPVLSTLDNLYAYFDPRLCPPDFLSWLAGWVGIELDDELPDSVRRDVVAHAAGWQRARGTAAGLIEQLEWLTGVTVDIQDEAAVTWSLTPVPPRPQDSSPAPRVRVLVDASAATVDVERLQALVDTSVPAHVVATVEVQP